MVVLKNSRAVSGITLYTCPFTETATPLQLHWRMQNVALKSTLSCRPFHLLKRLNHVVRAFQMAGTSDTNADFYHTQ